MVTEPFYCGVVSSEGGPVVLMEGAWLPQWPGFEEFLLRHPEIAAPDWESGRAGILGASLPFLLWDIGGAGTVDIFTAEHGVTLIRAWTDETDDEAELRLITEIAHLPGVELQRVGEIEVVTGVLCVLWAVEEGTTVSPTPRSEDEVTWIPHCLEWMSEESGRFLRVLEGIYECYTDVVTGEDWSVYRCQLIRKSPSHESSV